MGMLRRICVGGLVSAASAPVGGQVTFTEVDAAVSGFQPIYQSTGMTSGAAAADFDNDGDIDLFVPDGEGAADRLYVNRGDGTFVESAAAVGLATSRSHRSALWFDANSDGLLDLVVAGDCHAGVVMGACEAADDIRLFQQTAGGMFVDVTVASGIDEVWFGMSNAHRGGLAAGDLNNDGRLDLVTTFWRGPMGVLMNQGDGRFVNVVEVNGIGAANGFRWQPLIFDFNGDGWQDIFVAVDFDPNELWINQGNGAFVDEAAAWGVDSAFNEMGIATGDYDNDGDFDLYVTNIHDYTASGGEHNVFYERVGDVFIERSAALGVDDTDWGWGTTFFDADLDGWIDLAATNGFDHEPWNVDASRFFRNAGAPGGLSFIDESSSSGFNDRRYGSTLLAIDVDRDGDVDLIQTCLGMSGMNGSVELFLNDTPRAGGWLTVRPRMTGTNHFAIGAVVEVLAGELSMRRLITAGTSNLGQEPAEALFGLGDRHDVDEVAVRWPDGRVTRVRNVAGNRVLDVTDCDAGGLFDDCRDRACAADCSPVYRDGTVGNGVVNIDDVLAVVSRFGEEGGRCDVSPSYGDGTWGNGLVDVDDLLTVIGGVGGCE